MKFVLLIVMSIASDNGLAATSQQITFPTEESCKQAGEMVRDQYKRNFYVSTLCVPIP